MSRGGYTNKLMRSIYLANYIALQSEGIDFNSDDISVYAITIYNRQGKNNCLQGFCEKRNEHSIQPSKLVKTNVTSQLSLFVQDFVFTGL